MTRQRLLALFPLLALALLFVTGAYSQEETSPPEEVNAEAPLAAEDEPAPPESQEEETATPEEPPLVTCEQLACSSKAQCQETPDGAVCVCNVGYVGNGIECKDIDECAAPSVPCSAQAICTNTEGGYECTCKRDFTGDGFTCVPITHTISAPVANEPDGIYLELRGGDVIKMTQSEAKSYEDAGWAVRRRGGGFAEAHVFYELPAPLIAGIVGVYEIVYRAKDVDGNEAEPKTRTVEVTDIDECELNEHTCSAHAICTNTIGSYTCECKPGFTGDGFKCADVNECKLGIHDCDIHAQCVNTLGSYTCVCGDGYEGDGKTCHDIDECARNTHECNENAYCINLEGKYNCSCKEGWEGDGYKCEPMNKCEHQKHDCHLHATCVKSSAPEGYTCICNSGFVGNGRHCEDVNECQEENRCAEHAYCINTEGGYECACNKGYEKAADNYTCADIDECATETDTCSPYANCTNTQGGYYCTCKTGWDGDGYTCTQQALSPDILLRGDKDHIMKQCETYREEGFVITETSRNKALRVNVMMPPALMEDPVMTIGTFQVKYDIIDGDKHKSTEVRNVTVEVVNPCTLPERHPCRHNCSKMSECVFDGTNYRCRCPEGFAEADGGGCVDTMLPVINLFGSKEVELKSCRLCEWQDYGEIYDERKHGGFEAFDLHPDGTKQDLTSLVTVRNVTIEPDSEWQLTYEVTDDSGNKAIPQVRIVKRRVQDVLQRIDNMEQFLHKRFSEFEPYPKKIEQWSTYGSWLLQATAVFVGVWVLLVVLPRIYSLMRINFSSTRPDPEEFADAYDFLYFITMPFDDRAKRKRRVEIEYRRRYYDEYEGDK